MKLDRGLSARGLSSLFYAYRNTINIFTEDQDKDKKFYSALFKKLLDGTGVVINDIHPLGSCKQVIKHCEENKDTTMPRLYIIDGDIYLMTEKTRSPRKHLYILDAYCIENKVIDETAYYKVFDYLDPIHNEAQIKSLANYDTMMSKAEVPFMHLYCHMAVCRDILSIHRLKSAKNFLTKGSISTTKLEKECKEIKDCVLENSSLDEDEFNSLLSEKISKYPPNRDNLMKYISGKDYLMVYIDEYTKVRLNAMSGQSKEFWKFQFLQFCDLSSLEGLKNAIIKEVRDFNDVKMHTA